MGRPWAVALGGAGCWRPASWVVARRAARRAAQLSDMYWQLRYDHGELKARVDAPSPGARAPRPAPAPGTHFVALADVKR